MCDRRSWSWSFYSNSPEDRGWTSILRWHLSCLLRFVTTLPCQDGCSRHYGSDSWCHGQRDSVSRPSLLQYFPGWWFQMFFFHPYTWEDDPIWLIIIFLRWVGSTTNGFPFFESRDFRPSSPHLLQPMIEIRLLGLLNPGRIRLIQLESWESKGAHPSNATLFHEARPELLTDYIWTASIIIFFWSRVVVFDWRVCRVVVFSGIWLSSVRLQRLGPTWCSAHPPPSVC